MVADDGFDRKPLIDRNTDSFCRRALRSDLLWFSCGTCRRSRISPCISLRFFCNQAQQASCR